MSTIVFFCIPAYGHTNPTLGVVRELAARGHKVVYYSYDTMRKPIEAAGAVFVSILKPFCSKTFTKSPVVPIWLEVLNTS